MKRSGFFAALLGAGAAVLGLTRLKTEPKPFDGQTLDGREWARAFIERVKAGLDPRDESWMTGWFANAIERGRDQGKYDAASMLVTDGERSYLWANRGWCPECGGIDCRHRIIQRDGVSYIAMPGRG